jgi:hypothetical protein
MKAAIYNLAPPLSVILSYDSLWISEYWSAMFVGAALRGVRVFPLGPTDKNAPSSAPPTLYYLHRNLEMLLRAQIYFDEEIERAGGMMRIGLYANDVPTDDLGKRIAAFVKGRENYPFLKELFPFHPSIESLLMQSLGEYEQISITELHLRPRPLLHLKNQLFGTREAFEVVRLREWNEILVRHIRIRERQLQEKKTEGVTPKVLSSAAGANLDHALRSFLKEDSPGSEERVILTFTIGSHNQNPRSMVLDGEVLVAVSGINSFVSAIDFMFIMGVSSWPRSLEEYNDLFPPPDPSGVTKFFYSLIKYQL